MSNLTIITIPSHFRFKKEEEAKHWGRTTMDWIPISDIKISGNNYIEISAASFAWISYNRLKNNLEFKYSKFNKKDLKEFNNE